MSIWQKNSQSQFLDVFIVIGVYLILICFHGYRFGDEDLMESLSYAKYLRDNTLYPLDPYIQAAAETFLNERFPFAALTAIGINFLPWYCFLLHLTSSLLFILAILRISQRYVKQPFWQVVFLLSFLLASYQINLGENEAWYHYLMPSHLAKVFGIWAIYYFLEKRELRSYGLLVFSTLMHPIVGAQLALIFGLILAFEWLKSRFTVFTGWQGIVIYGATAGLWIMLIFWGHLVGDSSLTRVEYYEILEQRLGHHFFPSYYPMRSWLLLIPLFIVAGYFWRKIESRIFGMYIICGLGMIAYVILIEGLEIPEFLSLQWFKTSVWLKPLSILVILSQIAKSPRNELLPKYSTVILLGIGLLLAISQVSNLVLLVDKKPYFLPFLSYETEEMQLAREIEKRLPKDALLLIPPNLTGTRLLSERSLYVDYKSNIHSKRYMGEAARRREALYGMNLSWRREGKPMVSSGLEHYRKLTGNDFKNFKMDGATHVLVEKNQVLELEEVLGNDSFAVYKL